MNSTRCSGWPPGAQPEPEGGARLLVERNVAVGHPLAGHTQQTVVQVHVVDRERGEFGDPHAGLEKDLEDGVVARCTGGHAQELGVRFLAEVVAAALLALGRDDVLSGRVRDRAGVDEIAEVFLDSGEVAGPGEAGDAGGPALGEVLGDIGARHLLWMSTGRGLAEPGEKAAYVGAVGGQRRRRPVLGDQGAHETLE